jgi:serine protease Do
MQTMGTIDLSMSLDDQMAELTQRVYRSLVIVHNGHRGAGAGVIWREGGYIITNHHVVARGEIFVIPPGGQSLPARLVKREPEIDLALLQVDLPAIPPVLIADSRDLKVGQIVLAVGHPWGQRDVVTSGIITSLGTAEVRGSRMSVPIIRSDVTLAPGNSGGPLVNAVGGVIGINTMIVGGDLAVAIPSHLVDGVVNKNLGQKSEVV